MFFTRKPQELPKAWPYAPSIQIPLLDARKKKITRFFLQERDSLKRGQCIYLLALIEERKQELVDRINSLQETISKLHYN